MGKRQNLQNHNRNAQILVMAAGLFLVVAAMAGFIFLPGSQAQPTAPPPAGAIPAPVNFPAPKVELTDLDGNPAALSDYRGQVILYNAWATWCPPCKEEMPTLQAYYEAHKTQGFVIVAIEDGQPVDEVAAFVHDYGLTFLVWPDLEYRATTAFRTNSLPSSFVIDRQGTVRLAWVGAITREALETYVTPLLEE